MSVRCLCRFLTNNNQSISRLASRTTISRSYSVNPTNGHKETRDRLREQFSSRLTSFQQPLLFAKQKWHDFTDTDYSSIERLKQGIEHQRVEVATCVKGVKDAKDAYVRAVHTRSESQREHNELLQRKNSWSSSDLERFTTLIRNEHLNLRNEEECKRALEEAEEKVEQARTDLDHMTSEWHHEEHVWRDKGRLASTWGTWALLAFNILLLIAHEPWKRRTLVESITSSFEDKVRKVVREERLTQELAVQSDQIASQIDADVTFLTDADHAAEAYNHDQVLDLNTAFTATVLDHRSDESMYLTDADHAAASFDPEHTNTAVVSAESKSADAPKNWLQSWKPRVGTSAMLTTMPTWPIVLQALKDLPRTISTVSIAIAHHLKILSARVLSSRRSLMRVEDITSACFASGVMGMLIGMSIGRIGA